MELKLCIKHQPKIAYLYHLKSFDSFEPFGFEINSFTNQSIENHFIGIVINGSHAESIGLAEGGRILAVNNVDISGMKQDEVMDEFKATIDILRLLVTYTGQIDLTLTSKRLLIKCHLKKKEKSDEYGFELIRWKSKPGHFIGTVDSKSPAEASSLRQGLRLIEVNGKNVINESHKEVVERIKRERRKALLLVVDPEVVAVPMVDD